MPGNSWAKMKTDLRRWKGVNLHEHAVQEIEASVEESVEESVDESLVEKVVKKAKKAVKAKDE